MDGKARGPACAAVLVLALAGSSALARADAIDVPGACPTGSEGTATHGDAWCAPSACATDQDCAPDGINRVAPGRVCREAGLCVVEEDSHEGRAAGNPVVGSHRVALAVCAAGSACASGTCEVARRCVPGPPATAATCGCAVGGSRATQGVLGAMGWLGLAMLLRRARRACAPRRPS